MLTSEGEKVEKRSFTFHLFYFSLFMTRTRILITNDDGYHSDGIAALESGLKEIGDVFVGRLNPNRAELLTALRSLVRCVFVSSTRGIGRSMELRPIASRLH